MKKPFITNLFFKMLIGTSLLLMSQSLFANNKICSTLWALKQQSKRIEDRIRFEQDINEIKNMSIRYLVENDLFVFPYRFTISENAKAKHTEISAFQIFYLFEIISSLQYNTFNKIGLLTLQHILDPHFFADHFMYSYTSQSSEIARREGYYDGKPIDDTTYKRGLRSAYMEQKAAIDDFRAAYENEAALANIIIDIQNKKMQMIQRGHSIQEIESILIPFFQDTEAKYQLGMPLD